MLGEPGMGRFYMASKAERREEAPDGHRGRDARSSQAWRSGTPDKTRQEDDHHIHHSFLGIPAWPLQRLPAASPCLRILLLLPSPPFPCHASSSASPTPTISSLSLSSITLRPCSYPR